MSSGLTLGFARTNLPTAALAAQKAATAATAAPDVNAATSWLIHSGKWRGTIRHAIFVVYDNEQVTLPRGMLTVEAAVMQGTGDQYRMWARMNIANEWFQWLSGGPGYVSAPPCNTSSFTSLGDGFVFFRKLPSVGTIKITSTTGENEGLVNIRGFDSAGMKVFTGVDTDRIEGENLDMPETSGTSSTSTTIWNSGDSIYGVVKPPTNGVLLVYHVASSDATETLIARYEPGEQIPNYRRYLVPKGCIEDYQVVALCKVRHVPVAVDNDEIIPGNLQALEMALMAVNFRRKAEMDKAMNYIQMAIEELNSEVADFNAIQSWGVAQIDPFVAMSQSDNVI